MSLCRGQLARALLPDPVDEFTDLPLLKRQRESVATGIQPGDMRDAAVLVPLVERSGEWWVILTRRTEHLKNHGGQVSFPGGAAETQDSDAATTATREANEEIGLDPKQVSIVGYLAEHPVISGFSVTPVIAVVNGQLSYQPDPSEVAEVFEVPWQFITDPANHEIESRQLRGRIRYFYRLQYERHKIWGATAGILVDLAVAYAQAFEPDR